MPGPILRFFAVAAVLATLGCASASGGSPAPTGAATASARQDCVPVDTTLRLTSPVYYPCGVTQEAKVTGRPPRVTFTPTPGSSATCYRAVVEFVVDERGEPMPSTARVVRTTDNLFAQTVIGEISSIRYTPAQKDGTAVKQWVRSDHSVMAVVQVAGAPAPRRPSRHNC